MYRFSWKNLSDVRGDKFLTWLHESSVEVWGAICVLPRFFTTRIPEILRKLFGDLKELAVAACRYGYQLGRFIGVVLIWFAILLLPVFIFPGWLTAGWIVVVLVATGWSLEQHSKKRRTALAAQWKAVKRG